VIALSTPHLKAIVVLSTMQKHRNIPTMETFVSQLAHNHQPQAKDVVLGK